MCVLAFGFEKIENKECDEHKYGIFYDFEDAQIACKGDKNCSSIYNVDCENSGNFHLCPANTTKASLKDCTYLKFLVGKFCFLFYFYLGIPSEGTLKECYSVNSHCNIFNCYRSL